MPFLYNPGFINWKFPKGDPAVMKKQKKKKTPQKCMQVVLIFKTEGTTQL